MKNRSRISRWLGWLATIVAAGLIVLAVLVGIARLLLPMAPEYQDDIRRFANEATGFDVQFGRLSASWPLHGPEIRFFDVQIRTRDGQQPVLDAAELSVGINLLQLITERRLLPGRVSVRAGRCAYRAAAGRQGAGECRSSRGPVAATAPPGTAAP